MEHTIERRFSNIIPQFWQHAGAGGGRRGARIGQKKAMRLVILPVQTLAVLGAVMRYPALLALEQLRCGRAA